jgi:hypothetical protein
MSVREQIIAKMQAAGYDVFTACEETDRVLAEFRASGEKTRKFGVMANRTCVDAFELRKETGK